MTFRTASAPPGPTSRTFAAINATLALTLAVALSGGPAFAQQDTTPAAPAEAKPKPKKPKTPKPAADPSQAAPPAQQQAQPAGPPAPAPAAQVGPPGDQAQGGGQQQMQ